MLSCVQLFATPWNIAHQAPLSIGFSRQEYWSALPFLSLGDLPDPGIKPGSPELLADCLQLSHQGKPKGTQRRHQKEQKCIKIPQAFYLTCFLDSSVGKESAYNAGDPGLIPGSGRSAGGGNGNPLQYSCLENPMGREAW